MNDNIYLYYKYEIIPQIDSELVKSDFTKAYRLCPRLPRVGYCCMNTVATCNVLYICGDYVIYQEVYYNGNSQPPCKARLHESESKEDTSDWFLFNDNNRVHLNDVVREDMTLLDQALDLQSRIAHGEVLH